MLLHAAEMIQVRSAEAEQNRVGEVGWLHDSELELMRGGKTNKKGQPAPAAVIIAKQRQIWPMTW